MTTRSFLRASLLVATVAALVEIVSASQNYQAFIPKPLPGRFTYDILAQTSKPIGGRTIDRVLRVAVNDSGAVVFTAFTTGKGRGVFMPDRMLAAAGEPLPNGEKAVTVSYPAINAKGQIAYGATYRESGCKLSCNVLAYFVDQSVVVAFRYIGTPEPFSNADQYDTVNSTRQAPPSPYDPVLTEAGEVLLTVDTFQAGRITPPGGEREYFSGLSLNGRAVLPKGTGFAQAYQMLGDRTVSAHHFAAVTGDEIVFTGHESQTGPGAHAIYSTKRGNLSAAYEPFQPRFSRPLFVNGKGQVAMLLLGKVLVDGKPIDPLHDKRFPLELFGFNDAAQFLWRTGDVIALGDVAVAVRRSVAYMTGPTGAVTGQVKVDSAGIPALPVTLGWAADTAALNNAGQVVLGINAGTDASGKQEGSFIVLASPAAPKGAVK